MLISSLKLKGKNCELMVIVGADSIKDPTCGTSALKHGLNYCGKQDCEESELLYDLKTKYLSSFSNLEHVLPTSFEKACASRLPSMDQICVFLSKFMYSPLISITEMIPHYDSKVSLKQKFEDLISAIHEKAEQDKKIFAILIDEMPPSFFETCAEYEEFFQHLQNEYPLVYIFMAISPSGRNLTQPIKVKFKDDRKIFAKQLRTRHRNSFLLSNFLIHLTYSYNKLKQAEVKFQCLSPNQDVPLDASNLPDGEITLWYHQSEDISDIEILKFLHDTYLPEDGQVLVSPYQQNLSQRLYDWCLEKKWDIVTHANMTGSERDWVIAFADDNFGNLEVMSRARKRLIIITR